MPAANGVATFHFSLYSRASGREHANWMSSSVSTPSVAPVKAEGLTQGYHQGYQGAHSLVGRRANGVSDGVHAPEGRDGGDERLRIDRFGEVQLKAGRESGGIPALPRRATSRKLLDA